MQSEGLREFQTGEFALSFVLHVDLVVFYFQFCDCFKFSLAISKFECLLLHLSTMKSVDWKLIAFQFTFIRTYGVHAEKRSQFIQPLTIFRGSRFRRK